MGWVGVVTLVATACYVLYRFPPRTWRDPVPPGSTSGQGDKTNGQELLEPERLGREEREYVKEDGKTDHKDQEETEEEEEIDADADTPKASPAKASLEVPEFNLEHAADHKAESEKTSTAAPVAKAPNGPVIMPPSLPASPQPPPSLPAPSPQRTRNPLMPPPPPPLRQRTPAQQAPSSQTQSQLLSPGGYPARAMNSKPSGSSFLAPPPSAAASLRGPPPGSLAPPRTSNSLAPPTTSSGLAPPLNSLKPSKNAPRRAVLEPGYSPLDWAALTSNPKNTLRGANLPPTLIRVTPSMLKTQNGRKGRDVWTSYQGKVYNLTPYVPFHPGGKGELLRGAGKDSGKLFLEVHPWVNWDAILGECLVGILVAEEEQTEGNTLDAMD